jgi:glycosyltransferase involved in cell wall biosynthesis
MPKISVIVPVYNAEEYLDRCIESIVNQTFADFECILVDDCSKDKSYEICEEIAKKDSRFIAIHRTQNGGNAKTRRTGLDVAKGEFVVHIDNDDWIELNALELLIQKQKETDADIVVGGFKCIFDNFIDEYLFPEISKDISPLEYFFYTRCRMFWGKLVKKELYDNVIVPPSAISIGDDAIYNTQVFAKLSDISQIAKIDFSIYNWDARNQNSITHTTIYSYKNYYDDPRIGCRLWIEKYLKSINANEKIIDGFRFYMIIEGIVDNFKYNKLLSKKDVKILYNNYFVPFSYKNKLSFHYRTVLETFNVSIILGRFYIAVKGILGKIKSFTRKIKY